MSENRYQLAGLSGFVLSGLVFLAAGVRSDDLLTVAGSLVWIVACIIWAVPFLRAGAKH